MTCSTFHFLLAKISRWFGFAISAALICTAGLEIAPAHAQEIDYGRVVDLVKNQGMLVEKMSKESVLIALEGETEGRLAALQDSHERFNRVQAGLREGNSGLGLTAITNPVILDRLAVVEDLWPLFDGAIRSALGSGAVGRGEVDTLAELNAPLLEALGGAVDAYEAEARSRQLHSMLDKVISTASRQRLLSQRMAKEFFLVAYSHETEKNRSRLKQSTDQFDQIMTDLLQGRARQALIAPPTPEIRSQLDAANQVWRQIRPLMAPVITGGAPGNDEVLKVAELNVKLLEAVNQALTLYMAL